MRKLFLGLLGMIALAGCERNTGDIGLDYVNGNSADLGYHQSVTVVATTQPYDSMYTSQPNALLVGGYDDPVFGRIDVKSASQLLLVGLQPDFGSNATADSVFLVMPYSGYYGDSAQDLRVHVQRLVDTLALDSSYLSTQQLSGAETLVDTILEHPTSRNGMVLVLDTAFFQQWIIDASVSEPEHFELNSKFIEYLPGIIFSSDQTAQSIFGGDVTELTAPPRIRIYYSNDSLRALGDSVPQYMAYELAFNSAARSLNMVTADHSQATFDMSNQDTTAGEITTYLQALGGVVTEVKLDGLQPLRDSGYLVNYATLTIPVREGSAITYQAPQRILGVVQRGNSRALIRDYMNSSDPGGDLIVHGVLRDRKYVLEITRHVQNLFNQKDSAYPRILIVPEGLTSSPRRAILNGNLDPVNPIRLDIYTTKP